MTHSLSLSSNQLMTEAAQCHLYRHRINVNARRQWWRHSSSDVITGTGAVSDGWQRLSSRQLTPDLQSVQWTTLTHRLCTVYAQTPTRAVWKRGYCVVITHTAGVCPHMAGSSRQNCARLPVEISGPPTLGLGWAWPSGTFTWHSCVIVVNLVAHTWLMI